MQDSVRYLVHLASNAIWIMAIRTTTRLLHNMETAYFVLRVLLTTSMNAAFEAV